MNLQKHIIHAEEMLNRARRGDSRALEMLYKQHHERLLAIACRYIPDVETARDVEHDAWVMILTSLDSLHDSSKIASWMGSIVRNMALNYLKLSHNNQHVPLEQADHTVTEPASNGMPPISVALIQEMVQRLPHGYEQVFRLSTFEGLSHQEIGQRLGITASSSRSQLTRARKMLQEMLKRHWALLATLLALLLPLGIVMMNRNRNDADSNGQRPVANNRQPKSTANSSSTATIAATLPQQTSNACSTTGTNPVAPAVMNFGTAAGASASDSANLIASFTTPHLPSSSIPATTTRVPELRQNWQQPTATQNVPPRRRINLHLAYGGAPAATSSLTDNFLSVINFAGGETQRSMRLYNAKEFHEYLRNNVGYMDSVDAKGMTLIGTELNDTIAPGFDSEGGSDKSDGSTTPLKETKHHERPRTVQLSLSMPLSPRWTLTSGLGFTWMKSTFETDFGNNNHNIRRTQRLYYLNVPLGATYTIWQRRRWSVYASGSVRLDIPVRGRETTQYIYTGSVPHAAGDSIVFPSTHTPVKAPWQWSVGAGVGVQYQLLPHVNAYFEPGFRYYIPTGSPVETYRTVHPFDVALPFGIRIVP